MLLPLFFILIALGAVLEIVSLRRDPSKVDVEYGVSTHCTEPGAVFSVQVSITNRSRVPISYLAVSEVCPEAAALPEGMASRVVRGGLYIRKFCRVGGRKRKKLMFETSINKRGAHVFRGDALEFGDFLGFREIVKWISPRQEVVVYPGRFECARLTDALGSFCGDIASRRFLIRDPILTVGSREYTGREPMRDIHWLQTAHRGEIMVREYDYTRQLSACVLLCVDGFGYDSGDELDDCCAAARTICETLVGAGVTVSFFTNAVLQRKAAADVWRCEVSQGREGGLLEGLGRVSRHCRCPFEKLLDFAHRESDFEAAFIIIMHSAFSGGGEAADRLKSSSGREVLVVRVREGGVC